MALGEILDGAFRLLRADLGPILLAVGAVVVPTQIVLTLLSADVFAALDEQLLAAPAAFDVFLMDLLARLPALIGVSLLQSVLLLLATAAVMRISAARYLGDTVRPGQALRDVAGRLLPLVGAQLLALLAWIAPMIIASVLLAVAIASGDGALIAVAVLVLLATVPLAVWLYVRFALAIPGVVVEGQGPVGALRRSAELVRGRWWPVFGTLLLALIVVFLVSIALSAVLSLPAGFFDPTSGLALTLSAVGDGLATLITQPVQALIVLLLYFDGRVRREGLDLELRQDATVDGWSTSSDWPSPG